MNKSQYQQKEMNKSLYQQKFNSGFAGEEFKNINNDQ